MLIVYLLVLNLSRSLRDSSLAFSIINDQIFFID